MDRRSSNRRMVEASTSSGPSHLAAQRHAFMEQSILYGTDHRRQPFLLPRASRRRTHDLADFHNPALRLFIARL
jgi:hypothetical protein